MHHALREGNLLEGDFVSPSAGLTGNLDCDNVENVHKNGTSNGPVVSIAFIETPGETLLSVANVLGKPARPRAAHPPFLPMEDMAHLKKLLVSLSGLYQAHIKQEDDGVFPEATGKLAEAELRAIGRRMAARRGVLLVPDVAEVTCESSIGRSAYKPDAYRGERQLFDNAHQHGAIARGAPAASSARFADVRGREGADCREK
jgi:hypothetical protein